MGAALVAARAMLQRHSVLWCNLPHDLPLVKFDAVAIERVLVNLLENVSKYTPAGSTVTLSARGDRRSLERVGRRRRTGLALGREEAVFQKFTRGERDTATPGVGLGLAICRAIIESHHGKIVASQRPGGGAKLHLYTSARQSAAGDRI